MYTHALNFGHDDDIVPCGQREHDIATAFEQSDGCVIEPLHRIHHHLTSAAVRIIDKLVERQLGLRPDTEDRLVQEQKLRGRSVAGADTLIGIALTARRECARIAALNLVFHGGGDTDFRIHAERASALKQQTEQSNYSGNR